MGVLYFIVLSGSQSFSVVFFFKQKTADELRISDWRSDVCSSDLAASDRPRLAVQTMRNVRAKRRQEYLTIRTAKGARRGLRRSYCAWSRYGDILRHQRHLSNSTFGARPE